MRENTDQKKRRIWTLFMQWQLNKLYLLKQLDKFWFRFEYSRRTRWHCFSKYDTVLILPPLPPFPLALNLFERKKLLWCFEYMSITSLLCLFFKTTDLFTLDDYLIPINTINRITDETLIFKKRSTSLSAAFKRSSIFS